MSLGIENLGNVRAIGANEGLLITAAACDAMHDLEQHQRSSCQPELYEYHTFEAKWAAAYTATCTTRNAKHEPIMCCGRCEHRPTNDTMSCSYTFLPCWRPWCKEKIWHKPHAPRDAQHSASLACEVFIYFLPTYRTATVSRPRVLRPTMRHPSPAKTPVRRATVENADSKPQSKRPAVLHCGSYDTETTIASRYVRSNRRQCCRLTAITFRPASKRHTPIPPSERATSLPLPATSHCKYLACQLRTQA